LNVAETIARVEGVLLVEFDAIVFVQGYGDATLRVLGGRFPQRIFRDDEDGTCLRQLDGGTHTGDTGSNYEKVAVIRQSEL
jgi:hypothetical protein